MANPLFPDVPIAKGLPSVFRAVGSVETQAVSIIADVESILGTTPPKWGIFSVGGDDLLQPDSMMSFEVQKEAAISTYPIEQGDFQSYNKVQRPYETRVTATKGGKSGDRTDFLSRVEDLQNTTDVCTVVTPERTYLSANVVRYDYARHASEGAELIMVNMQIEEVRQTVVSTFNNSNTAQPSGADTVNDGTVQAQPVSVLSGYTPAPLAGT